MSSNPNCSTCRWWKKIPVKGDLRVTPLGSVGECTGGPPPQDFRFPRTDATMSCKSHEPFPAEPKEPRGPDRLEYFGPGAATANAQPEGGSSATPEFDLDTAPPKARGGKGKR